MFLKLILPPDTPLFWILWLERWNSDVWCFKTRDQCLNSQVPGLSSQRANLSDPHIGQQEMLEMAKEYEKNPTDKIRQRYINLAKELLRQSWANLIRVGFARA